MTDTQTQALAARMIGLLDLTDLSNGLNEAGVDDLCRRAMTPAGPVAAVCLWAGFVPQARRRLAGTGVRVATVVNFPEGGTDVATVCDETRYALLDGADEIDLVLPWRALKKGDQETPGALIGAVRALVPASKVLKVILETGELGAPGFIAEASDLAITVGADFIKTSTGKTPISATPEAASVMLGAIKASGRKVGFKASGGIRTFADARIYLDMADGALGPVDAANFRFGASGLLTDLLATLGAASAPQSASSY